MTDVAMPAQDISYAQRYEDIHLLRAFGEQAGGCYIDIGAGHPVYDNVSFAFYLRGWRGITVEPNPWLAQLSEAVRPHDTLIQSLVGEKPGEATYYLVDDFHGLSTTVERHAHMARSEFGKASTPMTMPVTTLRTLCERHAPPVIDFLKIDVEGAERAVLLGNDWRRFRPRMVLAEALEPVTMAPAWEPWEPLLTGNGYRFAYFDNLNRYYVADECAGLADRLAASPASLDRMTKFSGFKPAQNDPAHPDHGLACLLAGLDMVRLPLMSFDTLAGRLLGGLDPAGPAQPSDIAAAHQRLFGTPDPAGWAESLGLAANATVLDLYRGAAASDAFRAACGRISASSAW
jgi:FkbM family methyltransferase